jgi:gas vesicle protein
MSEVEYQGIKVKGGKLLLIFPLLGTLGGAIWAGFEGYARWVAMEEKINAYVAPDLSGFNLELNVLEEKLNSIETTVSTELNAVKELVDVAQDDARTIKTDLKNDMYKLQDSMDQIVNDNRELNRSVHSKISDLETSTQYMIGDAGKNLNNLIQHASDRFDAKRTSIEESAQRRQDFLTDEMKNLEDRFDTKLQRALSNPLAGQ